MTKKARAVASGASAEGSRRFTPGIQTPQNSSPRPIPGSAASASSAAVGSPVAPAIQTRSPGPNIRNASAKPLLTILNSPSPRFPAGAPVRPVKPMLEYVRTNRIPNQTYGCVKASPVF